MNRRLPRSLLVLTALPLTLVASSAWADDPPAAVVPDGEAPAPASTPTPAPAVRKPGLLLRRGQLNVAVNLELEMSADKVGHPVSISPDVSYGVSDDVTIALVHSRAGLTGFRAAAGGGLCLTGTDGGCVAVYNNVGAEGWYRLGRGAVPLAVGVGVHATNLDAGYYAVKVGAKLRYPAGRWLLHAMPSVLVAVTEREDDAGNPRNKDTVWLPVQATYKLQPRITVGLGSGLKGPLEGFGDAWQISLGAMVQAAVDARLTVGASWVFGAIVGGAPAPATGPDARGAQLWLSYTR